MFSNKSLKNSLQLNVSIGSSQSRSESSSTTVVANGSEVKAEGNVHITSTEKDINITGSDVEGKDVTLNAKENLNITASKNTNKTEQNSKSSSASVGVGFDIATGQVSSVTISGSKSKGEVDANSTSYNESTVKADKKLDFTSGKDTNIKGGNLSGEKIAGNVGGDLKIESKQDKNSYKEKNSSAGFGVGIDLSGKNKNDGIATTDKKDKASNANKAGIFGSATKSNVDSNYNSVTDQSGIYAGKEGFDINVGENTDLKGGIISSTADADKNKLSTGTLTFEDIENKADYKAGSSGINVDTSKNAKNKDAGVTPNIGVGAKDNAESVTKATVSEGEIEIRDKGNQKQDLNKLNRDTQNSLNKLGEIFDKTKVEERQELAGLFGEIAYKAVGDLAIKNGWQEGSAEKNALHALVGGIMSELTKSGFLAGASGAMINEMIQDKLSDMFKDNPAMHQWASALIGGVVAQVVADNAQVGAATASSGTKNNYLTHEQYATMQKELDACENDAERQKVIEKYQIIDEVQNQLWYLMHNYDGELVEVGLSLEGTTVRLAPTANYECQIPEVNAILDKAKSDDDYIYTLPDGSTWAVSLEGDKNVLYKVLPPDVAKKALLDGTNGLVKNGILPNPKEMKQDYSYVYVGVGISKSLASSGGGVIDKEGNVYVFDQEQSGFGVSTPVYGGYGNGYIENGFKEKYKVNIIDVIAGDSSGFGASSIVSSGVSVTDDKNIITVEIGVESSAGVTIYSRRHAKFIGNIYSGE